MSDTIAPSGVGDDDLWSSQVDPLRMRTPAETGRTAAVDSRLRQDVGLERTALHSSDALVLCELAVGALGEARSTGDVTEAERALGQLRRSLDEMSQTISRLRDPLWDVHMRLTLQDEPLRLGAVIAEAVREWTLSLARSDQFEVRLDLPAADFRIVGDRRQLTVLMVTLCEILSGGGTECRGVRVTCRRHSPPKAEIQLEILRTPEQAADAIHFSRDTVALATSRCRLIARVHGGDLDSIGPDRAVITLGTLDETPGLVRRGEGSLGPWLTVRADAHIIERDGRRIRLSWTEWQLFAFLWDNPGVTFSRVELATGAWGSQWANRRGEVEIYISRIRRKVEHDARHPRVIRTVRGLGYRLDRN